MNTAPTIDNDETTDLTNARMVVDRTDKMRAAIKAAIPFAVKTEDEKRAIGAALSFAENLLTKKRNALEFLRQSSTPKNNLDDKLSEARRRADAAITAYAAGSLDKTEALAMRDEQDASLAEIRFLVGALDKSKGSASFYLGEINDRALDAKWEKTKKDAEALLKACGVAQRTRNEGRISLGGNTDGFVKRIRNETHGGIHTDRKDIDVEVGIFLAVVADLLPTARGWAAEDRKKDEAHPFDPEFFIAEAHDVARVVFQQSRFHHS